MRTSRVLLIEDTEDDAEFVSISLRRVSFEVHHVKSIADAVVAVEQTPPDVVLLDLGLSQSNGLDTFRLASAELGSFPIVVLTGDDNEELALQAVSEGAEDYLQKGQMDREVLRRSLRFAIERRARVDAQIANQTKTQFLAHVSHELRTPLTAMLGFADMLESEAETPSLREKAVTIKRNGRVLLALVNDLLDLSQVEAGKMQLESEPVDVRELLADVKSLMGVRAIQEGVPLTFEWGDEIPRKFMGDRLRVRQILLNLVSNALKFTDAGEVRFGIDVEEDGPAILFRITDTGVGLTEQQIKTLFEPFTQFDQNTTRRFSGAGLGLSISNGLAEAMNGEIRVESRSGEGSVFTVALPISDAELANQIDPAELTIAGSKQNTEKDLPELTCHVLLADDHRDVRMVGQYFLEKAGAQVTVVENGQQAVDAVLTSKANGSLFDLVLMDMQMPVLDGRNAVGDLRKLGFELPIVALTADAMKGVREELMAEGCDEYLAKPIDGAMLVKLVASLTSNDAD